MKRFWKTIILSMLLALTLCVGAQATENTMLKVGLKYGTNALFTARLQNYNDTLSGSGYEFGYYDADRSFVPLAVTDEQRITVTVDSNAYVSGGVCYETRPTNYSTILGAYHIELLTAFGSYEEALSVAQSYPKGFVAYIDGEYRVRVGNHASYDESARVLSETDVLAYGAQIVTPSSTGVVVSVTDTDTVLFEFDCSGLRSLGVRPRSVSGEKTVTWFSGYRYYGGFEYQRTTGGCWISRITSSASLRRKCRTTGRSRRSRRRQSARAPMPRLRRGTAAQALTSVQQQTVRPIAARHSPMSAPTRRRRRRAASISTTTASW